MLGVRWPPCRRAAVKRRMYAGTALILIGTIVTVIFGPIDGTVLIPLETLESYWGSTGWVVYFTLILATAACAEMVHRLYRGRAAQGRKLWAHSVVLPGSFSIASSLIGTQVSVDAAGWLAAGRGRGRCGRSLFGDAAACSLSLREAR